MGKMFLLNQRVGSVIEKAATSDGVFLMYQKRNVNYAFYTVF